MLHQQKDQAGGQNQTHDRADQQDRLHALLAFFKANGRDLEIDKHEGLGGIEAEKRGDADHLASARIIHGKKPGFDNVGTKPVGRETFEIFDVFANQARVHCMINGPVKADRHCINDMRPQQSAQLHLVADNGDLELLFLDQSSRSTYLLCRATINFRPEILDVISTKQTQKNGFDNDNCKTDFERQAPKQLVEQFFQATLYAQIQSPPGDS